MKQNLKKHTLQYTTWYSSTARQYDVDLLSSGWLVQNILFKWFINFSNIMTLNYFQILTNHETEFKNCRDKNRKSVNVKNNKLKWIVLQFSSSFLLNISLFKLSKFGFKVLSFQLIGGKLKPPTYWLRSRQFVTIISL